jgi:hypothetical protein
MSKEPITLMVCPFCGGRGRLHHFSFLGWCHDWAVVCEMCGTMVGYKWSDSEEEAVSKWNTRIDRKQRQQPISRDRKSDVAGGADTTRIR